MTSTGTSVAQYRAPSYSWAALDAGVYWDMVYSDWRTPLPADFHLVAHETYSRSLDPFGSMEGGYLELYGRLKPTIVIPKLPMNIGINGYGNAEIWQEDEAGLTQVRSLDPKVVLDKPNDYGSAMIDVYCFLLCSDEITWGRTYMLLLQPTRNKDEYVRIGIASLRGEDHSRWFEDCARQRFRLV